MVPATVISEDQFRLLLAIARELGMDYASGYDTEYRRSYLRVTHGDRHMAFHANDVEIL